MALTPAKMPPTTSINKYKNCNFNTDNKHKAPQIAGCKYKSPQKILESTGFNIRSGSADSNTQTFSNSPVWSIGTVSFHHLKPTRSRPAMFLRFQKSAEMRRMRRMKWRMKRLEEIKNRRTKDPKM